MVDALTVADALAAADQALRRLADVDLDTLSGEELSGHVIAMQRLRGRLEAADAHTISRWHAEQTWRVDGAKTPAAWLSWKLHLPIGEARRRVRHARVCRDHPAIARAWAGGKIDRAHISTLLGVRTARTASAFEADHEELLEVACTRGFVEFKRRCDLWEMTVDPDGAEQGADADRAAREVHLNQSFGGMWFGKLTLDPISGDIVAGTLSAIEQELFDTEWAELKARLGRDPLATDLDRTPAQRRADALVEMATRARTAPADGRRPAPLFTVVVGLESFVGPVLELFNRTVVSPGTAATWLTRADIERIVFASPSRVIDVGAQRRLFTGALRRAIEVRDRTCYHPTCDEPPDRPQIDHIRQASDGGPTTQTNGRLACGVHNRWRNTHPDLEPENDIDPVTHGDRTVDVEPETGPDPPKGAATA